MVQVSTAVNAVPTRAPATRARVAGTSDASFYTVLALTAVFVLYGVVALELTPLPTTPLPEDVFAEPQSDRFARLLLEEPGTRQTGSQHWWSDVPTPARPHGVPRVGSIHALAGNPRGVGGNKFTLEKKPRLPRVEDRIARLALIKAIDGPGHGGLLSVLSSGGGGSGFRVSGVLGSISNTAIVTRGAGVSSVRIREVEVRGDVRAPVVRHALSRRRSRLQDCSWNGEQRARVVLEVRASGSVGDVRVAGVGEELRACVHDAISTMRLPAPVGATEVRFVVLFRPPSE